MAFIMTGTTLLFGTSGFTAGIKSLNHSDISRESLDASVLDTPPAAANEIGSKVFLAGKLSDPGGLAIEGNFAKGEIPPIEGPAELLTVTFPLDDGEITPTIWSFMGQMTSYGYQGTVEEIAQFSAVIKASGPITVTDAT